MDNYGQVFSFGLVIGMMLAFATFITFDNINNTNNSCSPMISLYHKNIMIDKQYYVICSDLEGKPILTKQK